METTTIHLDIRNHPGPTHITLDSPLSRLPFHLSLQSPEAVVSTGLRSASGLAPAVPSPSLLFFPVSFGQIHPHPAPLSRNSTSSNGLAPPSLRKASSLLCAPAQGILTVTALPPLCAVGALRGHVPKGRAPLPSHTRISCRNQLERTSGGNQRDGAGRPSSRERVHNHLFTEKPNLEA